MKTKVYVNNTDISSLITSLTSNIEFSNDALIGNAPSMELSMKANNENGEFDTLLDSPFILKKEDGTQLGVFNVIEKPERMTSELTLELYDNMVKTNINYDTQLAFPTTIKNILDEISDIIGVDIDYSQMDAQILNQSINFWDNTELIRSHLRWIAEKAAGNFFADANGDLVFIPFSTTVKHTIPEDDVEQFEKIENFVLSGVLFDNGINPILSGTEISNVLYLDSQDEDNPYISTQSDVDFIYGKLNGLSFWTSNNIKIAESDSLQLGEIINIADDFTTIPISIKKTFLNATYDVLEISGEISTKDKSKVIRTPSTNTKIKRLKTQVDQNEATLNIVAQEVDDAVEKVGELELSVDEISLQVSETSEQVYKFESGSGNIFDNTYQYITKDSENTEVISATDMPLGINMDFMQGKDICISVQVQVKNGIIGSLEGYVGAEFEVGFSDNSKETYAVRWYAGQSSFQYVLATGSVDFDQRIYAHYKLPDKEITSVSNLKTIINLNAEFAYVANPKVEFGTYPTGYDFDMNYVRDTTQTIDKNYTLINQQVNELSLQAVSMTEEITTIKGDVSEVTTRLQSAEIKLQPTNILLAVNEQLGADGDLHTTKFVLDKDGVHISGGGLDVSNNAGTQVFYADTDGNLVLKGTIYATNGEFSGTITGSTINGTTITGGTINGTTITTDKDISVGTKITIAEASAAEMQNGIYIGEKFMIQVTPLMAAATIESKGEIYVVSRSSAGQTGMSAGVGNLTLFAENMIMVTANVTMTKNLTVQGTKNRLVETKSYGKRLLNAVESAYSVFEDFGIAFTDESGFCEVVIDPIFLETVNTSYEYYIFLTSFNGGQITVYEKGRNSFKVKGTPNTQFDWRICARQRDYEDIRLAIAGGSNEIKK